MTAVNCPLCELRFANRNERDWHLRNEHQRAHLHPPANSPAWIRQRDKDAAPADEQPAEPDRDEEVR
jgi:hypothetical protein